LTTAEGSWRLAFERNGLAKWDWHVLGNEFVYSQRLKEMLGYCNDHASSGGWLDFVHPEDMHIAKRHLEGILREEDHTGSAEYRVCCKDGSCKWVHVTALIGPKGIDGKTVLVMGLVSDVSEYRETPVTYRQRPAVMGFIHDITERKEVENALRESQAKYRALFQNAADAIFLLNGETIIDCNEKALEMFRCERKDIVERTIFDFAPTKKSVDDLWSSGIRERISLALSGIAQHFESEYRSCDGTLIDTDVSFARVEFEGNSFLHCTLCDVTDRNRREEALRESERKFRDLAEKSLVGIYLIQDGLFRYVNPQFSEILGYDAHELIGTKKHIETLLPEDRAMVVDQLRKRESGEIPSLHYTFRVVTKSGEVRNVEVYGSRTNYRGRPAVIGTLLDITERIRSENLLKQAEEKYRSIFENAVEGIILVSSSHEYMAVNSSMVKMFGYSTAEEFAADLENRETGLFVHPADHMEFFRKIYEEGGMRGFESEHYRKDGRRIWISSNVTTVKGTDDSMLRYVGTHVDITERKEAEVRLRRSEAGLRALIGSVNDVIALVDKKGRYERLNLENPEMLNASLAGPFKKQLKEAIPEETTAPFLAAVRKALKTRRTVHIEYCVETDEKERWFSTAISPMTDESVVSIARDITDLKMAESELRAKSLSLEETNSALRVLLRNMEEGKKELEENVVSNIRVLVMPHMGRLAELRLADEGKAHLDAIEAGLKDVASPFLRHLNQFDLTPTEVQVANYVRDGRTTKEIIELMHGTKDSVDMHRYHIRKKLGLNRTKMNLRSFLLTFR
jgi:PAS domain S-box-containing protein